jgi:hypothetical protein
MNEEVKFIRGNDCINRLALWGSRTRPVVLTWSATRPARIR